MLLLASSTFHIGFGNFNVLDFGAAGDGIADDSEAFLRAWQTACGTGGSEQTIIIPAERSFLLNSMKFMGPCQGNIVIRLLGNLEAPSNLDEWRNLADCWICFSNVRGLTLMGTGQINGRGSNWWNKQALQFDNCDQLTLHRVTCIDSPRVHITMHSCTGVQVSNVHISAPARSPNTDGFSLAGSRHVNIRDSVIATGDDCIAIKGGCSFINITGVQCGPGHGISVGSLGKQGGPDIVEEVHVQNCRFTNSENGARIKTWMGGYGHARAISFEQITLENAKNPIIINQQYGDGNEAVKVSDVTFRGFEGTSASDQAITLDCSELGCTHIAFVRAWEAVCGGETYDVPTLQIPEEKTFLLQPTKFKGPCKSNRVHVQVLGKLVAPETPEAWKECESDVWLSFTDVHNLTVNGSGQIDGRGSSWWSKAEHQRLYIDEKHKNDDEVVKCHRPKALHFQGCDDCIAINSGCSNLNITNIKCGPGHGISVGSLGQDGAYATVENVYVKNCSFNGTQNGVRIKTWQGGSGYAKNITFEQIRLHAAKNSIIIDQYYCDGGHACKNKCSAVEISDVRYMDIKGTSAKEDAIIFVCNQFSGCRNIVMDNINITSDVPGEELYASCYNINETSNSTLPCVTCLSNSTSSAPYPAPPPLAPYAAPQAPLAPYSPLI
ncbi:hypothetical protein ACLB2K_014546 [Fragaria x ananassa]